MLYTDRLTEHWTVEELCKPGDWHSLSANQAAQDNLVQLVTTVLEPLRALWGAPIFCVSGYRSPEHNARVGGAGQSRHMLGQAGDITPKDLDWVAMRAGKGTERDRLRLEAFTSLIEHHMGKELSAIGGIGKYPGWTHADIRPRGEGGHIARWHGSEIGSEQ